MRYRVMLLAVAALAIEAVPTEAADFVQRCSTGSIRTCASFQIVTVPLTGGGTQVFVRVRNEGVIGNGGAQWGSLLTRFGVIAPGTLANVQMRNAVDSRGTVFVEDGATVTGSPAGRWTLNHPNTNSLGHQVDFASSTLNPEGGIKSCVRSNANPKNFYDTCASGSPQGWVTFAFTTTSTVTENDLQIAWHVVAVGDGNPNNGDEGDRSIGGTTGPADAPPPPPPAETVPEPATVFLLGSGLAAVAARARKKKKADDAIV